MLEYDLNDISRFAGIGKGNDGAFEIATEPTDNPYLMLLEMKLLEDLDFIDLNFKKPGYGEEKPGYEKGSH